MHPAQDNTGHVNDAACTSTEAMTESSDWTMVESGDYGDCVSERAVMDTLTADAETPELCDANDLSSPKSDTAAADLVLARPLSPSSPTPSSDCLLLDGPPHKAYWQQDRQQQDRQPPDRQEKHLQERQPPGQQEQQQQQDRQHLPPKMTTAAAAQQLLSRMTSAAAAAAASAWLGCAAWLGSAQELLGAMMEEVREEWGEVTGLIRQALGAAHTCVGEGLGLAHTRLEQALATAHTCVESTMESAAVQAVVLRGKAQKAFHSRPPTWVLLSVTAVSAISVVAVGSLAMSNRGLSQQLKQRDTELAKLVHKIMVLQESLHSQVAGPILRHTTMQPAFGVFSCSASLA